MNRHRVGIVSPVDVDEWVTGLVLFTKRVASHTTKLAVDNTCVAGTGFMPATPDHSVKAVG